MNQYPIVLAHGIARFDLIRESTLNRLRWFAPDFDFTTDRLHYFRGIRSYLRRRGYRVYHSNVDFAGDLDKRARELSEQVAQILGRSRQPKAHLIGHSMGGLDARQMIVQDYAGMAGKVASLTTIGTPHQGTSFANWGLTHGGDEAIALAKQLLNWDLDGFQALTLEARQAFNAAVAAEETANAVFYQVYGSSQVVEQVFGPLQASWGIIKELEGEDKYKGANDGLVALASQLWQPVLMGANGRRKAIPQHIFPFGADHLNQLGWWDLNELAGLRWWHVLDIWRKKRYETAVKQLYRTIAQTITSLP